MLRKEKSQGFIIPISSLNGYISSSLEIQKSDIGVDFDVIDGKQICKKYIVKIASSDAAYKQIRDNAISEFRESLNRAISDASWVLCDEDKLKIMIEVASEFCYT